MPELALLGEISGVEMNVCSTYSGMDCVLSLKIGRYGRAGPFLSEMTAVLAPFAVQLVEKTDCVSRPDLVQML